MASPLNSLYSIINRYNNAKDKDRAFTFIEFIKEFGYDNSPNSFLNDYKDYLSAWSKVKKDNSISENEFIKNSFINTLKSIILDYSSYEEQDFLANLDWSNPEYCKAVLPFFAEKIKSICDMFKKKRAEAPYIINKHQFKGSRKSLEQIIYNKILDYYFNNRNLNREDNIKNLKENLSISIEQYIDIYSDYFDVPRYYNYSAAEREALYQKYINNYERFEYLSSNINDIDYNYFLNINTVLNDILTPGEARLEELPITAKLGLDLSGNCVDEATKLRDELLYNATLNQLTLNDQLGIRQRLYKKYLGCDLYYVYVDDNGNVSSNILVKADNPSGNLLNCSNPDVAAIENNEIELLSNVGLFFHPDKIGILKVNINNYEWEVDYDKLKRSTVYIFPDPNKYGNIGKNKKSDYPLIMEYKLDSYIRNASSGIAAHEPMGFSGDSYVNSYYSKQDDDYRLINNNEFNYSFTGLLNKGIIKKYATDIFGNEYGLLHKFTENADGFINVPSKFPLPGAIQTENNETKFISLNGGYIKNPKDLSIGDTTSGFNYDKSDILITNRYRWSGQKIFGGCILDEESIEESDDKQIHIKECLGKESENWTYYKDAYSIDRNEDEDEDENTKYTLPYYFGSEYKSYKDMQKGSLIRERIYFTNGMYEYVDYYKELGYSKTLGTTTGDNNLTEPIKNVNTEKTEYNHISDYKSSSNAIIYKNRGSLKSRILELDIKNGVSDFFIFADKLFVISKTKNDENATENNVNAIVVYRISSETPKTTKDLLTEIKTLSFSSNKFEYLYNETNEKIYTIELDEVKGSNKFNFIIKSYDIYTDDYIELVNTSGDNFNNGSFDKIDDAEFSMTFSFNGNLQKYLLCYAFSTLDKMNLYVHEFKLANTDNFYNTLVSTLYTNTSDTNG